MFDLHKTFKQLLKFSKYGIKVIEKNKECRKLFKRNNRKIRVLRGMLIILTSNKLSRIKICNFRMLLIISGISLFENIPQNRSCASALIPKSYCKCNKEISMDIDQFKKEIGKNFKYISELLINSLNDFTKLLRDKCEIFKLEKILSITKSFYLKTYYQVSI